MKFRKVYLVTVCVTWPLFCHLKDALEIIEYVDTIVQAGAWSNLKCNTKLCSDLVCQIRKISSQSMEGIIDSINNELLLSSTKIYKHPSS